MSDEPLEIPPIPSIQELAERSGQVLTEQQRAVREYRWDQGLVTLEALRQAHNALAADALRKSMFKSWWTLFLVFMGALATPVATAVWEYLKGFHHGP